MSVSRDHAPDLGSALDWADTLVRAYVIALSLAFLWVLHEPHQTDTRLVIGSFAVAAIYSAWPRRSTATPTDRDSSRDAV